MITNKLYVIMVILIFGCQAYGENVGADLRSFSQPVLGRPVYLGCLFDATRSKIMAGDSFWKAETVEKNKRTSTSFNSEIFIYAAQSTYERLSHMDFEASLKLEFLGGLISVEGSASYLKDSVESHNTVAVVMKAHYTTRSETLPTTTTKDYNDLCNLDGPTHVVTTISYGMDAHFVFKKTAKKDESTEKLAGSLKIAVNSIPQIKIEGEAKVDISGSVKQDIKDIRVKLFGDFLLDTQPTTYEESVRVYKSLASYLGTKPEYANAAKMKMHLTPITRFCDKKAAILVDISNRLLNSVTKMLVEIERTELRAKTIALSDSVHKYLPLKNIMNIFINKLAIFEFEIKGELQTLLPNIRGGGASSGENGLIQLLTKYKNSPFNYGSSNSFLDIRNREIKMLDFILQPAVFKGTDVKVLNFAEGTDGKIFFTKKLVVMIKFNILPSVDIVNQFVQGKKVNESASWFNMPQVIAKMGKEFKSFMQFASENKDSKERGYLVAMHNEKKNFLNIYAQKEGDLLSSNFKFPQMPSKIDTISNTYNSIIFDVPKPNSKWVKDFDIYYWRYAREESTKEKRFKFTKENSTHIEVTGLSPNEVYQFSIRYVTEMGTSPPGPETATVVTRPCSPPTNLRVTELASTYFIILWDPPLHHGKGVQIVNYELKVRENNVIRKIVVGERYAVVGNLSAASSFNVSIQANANTQKYNGTQQPMQITPVSLPSWIRVITTPDTPPAPNLVAISYHSAAIKWNSLTKIAVGATVEDYHVKYSMMNNKGNKALGSDMVQSSNNRTHANLTSLTQGTTYGISVKIVTSLGSSSYSPVLMVKTRYKETELDSLRNSVEQEIIHSVSGLSTKINEKIREVNGAVKNSQQLMSTQLDVKIKHNTEKLTDDIKNSQQLMSTQLDALREAVEVKIKHNTEKLTDDIKNLQQDIASELAGLRIVLELAFRKHTSYTG